MKVNKIRYVIYLGIFFCAVGASVLFGLRMFNFNVTNFAAFIGLVAAFGVFIPLVFAENDKVEDRKLQIKVITISSREYDKDLTNEIESKLNELNKTGKTIDSIQVVEATGYNDHRKEVYIICH